MVKLKETWGDKIMMHKNHNKQLIMPLVLSIVSLLYILIMYCLTFEYEQYLTMSVIEYYEIFQITFFGFALATIHLLIKANQSEVHKKRKQFLSALSLVLFIVSVCILFAYYRINILFEEQFSITKIIFGEYSIFKSLVSHSKRELHMLFGFFSIVCIISIFIMIIGYVFKKIQNQYKENIMMIRNICRQICFQFSFLSLGFKYKTIP